MPDIDATPAEDVIHVLRLADAGWPADRNDFCAHAVASATYNGFLDEDIKVTPAGRHFLNTVGILYRSRDTTSSAKEKATMSKLPQGRTSAEKIVSSRNESLAGIVNEWCQSLPFPQNQTIQRGPLITDLQVYVDRLVEAAYKVAKMDDRG